MSHKLAVAYRCFRSWCVTNRISCSQPPFTEGLVPYQKKSFFLLFDSISQTVWEWRFALGSSDFSKPTKLMKKRTNDILLTCKAYNGRVVCEWLGACVRQAAFVESYVAEDSRLPMCAVAQTLNWDWKTVFLCRTTIYHFTCAFWGTPHMTHVQACVSAEDTHGPNAGTNGASTAVSDTCAVLVDYFGGLFWGKMGNDWDM